MASPISQTEETKCRNALHMVRDALRKLNYTDDGKEVRSIVEGTFSFALDMRQPSTNRKIKILVQGSYANKTNIPSESDVDIAVILESAFISKYRPEITREHYGFYESNDTISSFKDDIERALKEYFAYDGVERHDKCIKVIGNSYRVDADVVPAYRYRDYSGDYRLDENNYIGGIEIHPDSGGIIINYPEQHIQNGRKKNSETSSRFKPCVRIIKNICEDMRLSGKAIPPAISSFGLESLLWNVPNAYFLQHHTIGYVFSDILDFLVNNTEKFELFKEANGIKLLFTDNAKRQAYIRFIKELYAFYEY